MEKRLFVAIKINPLPEFTRFFSEMKKRLKDEKIRWVDTNNLHLTLKFLGMTPAKKIIPVTDILSEISTKYKCFAFNLTGTGYLGARNNPGIIIINADHSETIKTVSEQINEGLSVTGFPKEEREFRAHLTLGRVKHIKDKPAFYSFLSEHEKTFLQEVRVEEITLFESILNSRGPVYKILQQFPLKR